MNDQVIAITGATGFLGKNICLRFQKHHEVHAICRQDSPGSDFLKSLGVTVHFEDLSRPKGLADILGKANVIVHLATANKPSSDAIGENSNLRMLENIFEHCDSGRLKKFIFASSGGSVYGTSSREQISEDQQPNPITQYGHEKIASENFVAQKSQELGFSYTTFRIANCYGPYQNYKAMHGFVAVALYKLHQNLPIDIWGDGLQTKDYIYVDDVMDLFERSLRKESSGIFNVGTGVGTTVNKIIDLCEKTTSKTTAVNYHPAKTWDIQYNVLNITRAKQTFDWQPAVSLESGIEKMYRWMLSDLDRNSCE